jgi:hypothetical protein
MQFKTKADSGKLGHYYLRYFANRHSRRQTGEHNALFHFDHYLCVHCGGLQRRTGYSSGLIYRYLPEHQSAS